MDRRITGLKVSFKRGEVWWVDFNPSISGEIQKVRPAIIISNDYSNTYLNRLQVIPLTTNTAKCFPSEAYVTFDCKKAKAMADQIMTVSKERLKSKISNISDNDMKLVEQAIKVQLSFNI